MSPTEPATPAPPPGPPVDPHRAGIGVEGHGPDKERPIRIGRLGPRRRWRW